MNTVKKIVVREPETAVSIEKGTVLKSRDDMFMVVEIENEYSHDVDENPCNEINLALYGRKRHYPKVITYSTPPTYTLVSLSTGGSRFGEPTTILRLKDRILNSPVKLHVVRSIEIKESN